MARARAFAWGERKSCRSVAVPGMSKMVNGSDKMAVIWSPSRGMAGAGPKEGLVPL